MNPIEPFHHVAADQSIWPFGSMIYCEEMDGRKTLEGTVHDGYFWVADVGSLIKGRNRFDVFVGHEKIYLDVLHKWADPDNHPREKFTIYKLPAPPSPDLDPLNGIKPVVAILKESGYALTGEETKDEEVAAELTKWQKRQKKVREAEFGNRRGATTVWFLMKAAHAVAEKRKALAAR